MAPAAPTLDRRRFLRTLAVGSAAAASGCLPPGPRTEVLFERLPRPNGTVPGYRGLAETPYFELDEHGRLVLVEELRRSLPPATDFHTHLGMALFLSPPIDYWARSERVDYLIDCDADPACRYAFDDYLNKIATPTVLHAMERKLVGQVLPWGSAAARTHTIPNLLAEMDRMHVERAVLLAVAPRLPFRNNPTEAWLEALAQHDTRGRLVLFCTVDSPLNGSAPAQLRRFLATGRVHGLKLHPTMQRFAPDDPRLRKLYEICAEFRVPVFFHAGRAGIEPRASWPVAEMRRYEAPLRDFPEVQFVLGHAGARDWRDAIRLAQRYENAWLEIEGQGVYELEHFLAALGPERLLFGSDWPFFPQAATLARLFLATEERPEWRAPILAGNAARLLGPRRS